MRICSTFLRTVACVLSLSVAFALPSDLGKLPLSIGAVDNMAAKSNLTAPIPLQAHSIRCLDTLHPLLLVPSDCSYVLNEMLLLQPKLFDQRVFRHNSYRTEAGGYARSRWQYGNCEVSVIGDRGAVQLLTFLDVAVTANSIFQTCVTGVTNPIGGTGVIGDVSKGFYVLLKGYMEPERNSEKNLSIPQWSAIRGSRREI